ncbi:N-acetylneuraminate 9-O-acetyltransferase-like [Daphnia carinata]|uniref:N-acetylneuraminate 9-O-acetyltransferase-like n=1 Tax=Daphnia carinata TaxID=120202 RepID=UPI00286844FD|nr:N-acetylneuraminate 9-O-acetyltransferase-like [Daphnia carinata]
MERGLRSENVRLFLAVGCMFCFLSSMIYRSIAWRTTTLNSIGTMNLAADNELPVCIGNLINGGEYHYAKEAKGSYISNRLMSDGSPCRLLQYTPSRIAACLDAMKGEKSVEMLHFLFMGDSRLRQHFFNFVRLLPDFDKTSTPTFIPNAYHENVEITSQILGLKLSFKWQPLINEGLMKMTRGWATSEAGRPHLIFLSMSVHHMFRYGVRPHENDFQVYEDGLLHIGPILGQLANVTQVIWLNQYPSGEFYGNGTAPNTSVFSEKIHLFNEAARRILGNYSSIRYYNSSHPWATEYCRSCKVFQRHSRLNAKKVESYINWNNVYVGCKDFIHLGYSGLSQATQLFLNDICNEHQVSYAI